MRPIRFRAWDIENREMIRVDEINFGMEIVGTYIGTDERGDPVFRYLNFKQVILMQYTGLKDKNGMEIYEGDIVNITQYFGGHPYGEIERVIKRSEYNNNLIADSESGDWRTPEVRMTFRSSDDYEVIGNIYQNPELIKNET